VHSKAECDQLYLAHLKLQLVLTQTHSETHLQQMSGWSRSLRDHTQNTTQHTLITCARCHVRTTALVLSDREFGTVCYVACRHLTPATNILKRYWRHTCLARPRRFVTVYISTLKILLLTYVFTQTHSEMKRKAPVHCSRAWADFQWCSVPRRSAACRHTAAQHCPEGQATTQTRLYCSGSTHNADNRTNQVIITLFFFFLCGMHH